MSLHEDLSAYVERSESLITESPQMDEQNTKRKLVEPFIELLGWDILTTDVELEYSVQMGAGTKKVDYALKLEDTPVVFVEAKGCDTSLSSQHVDQLTSYMRQLGVDWGLLTNGREFKIFRRDFSTNRPREICLAAFSLEAAVEHEYAIKALSVELIESGESPHIAEKIESVQRAVASLRDNKEYLAEQITSVVTETVGESVSQQAEDEAKNFVDELIDTLSDQAHRTKRSESDSSTPTTDADPYVARLREDSEKIHQLAGDTQASTMAAVVTYLIDRRGLLSEIDLPYLPGTERGSNCLLNTRPAHPTGEEMRTFQSVAEDCYLFTSLNSESKMRYLAELCEHVGLECEFSAAW